MMRAPKDRMMRAGSDYGVSAPVEIERLTKARVEFAVEQCARVAEKLIHDGATRREVAAQIRALKQA